MTRLAPGTTERIRSLIEICRLEEQYLFCEFKWIPISNAENVV